MARKPRKEEIQKIIKSLLDSELPEIQNVLKQLNDRIRQLEERSLKLQNYVTQIETLAIDESDVLVDARIHELVAELEKTLGERRQRPVAAVSESKAEHRDEADADVKGDVETKAVAEPEEGEVGMANVKSKKYITPEGLVVRKARR